MTKNTPEHPEEPQGNAWVNIGKIVFLVVTLVAAWYALEWLIEGK